MIEFVKGSKLSESLESMIEKADKFLWLISPYIKLSGRIKDDLKKLKVRDTLSITIVYGKNETDKTKSLSKEDFEFLSDFPNIRIFYESNLHAKYYASEDFALLCSMNLHEFSQNNNIEAGMKLIPKDILTGAISSSLNMDPESSAHSYFTQIIENSSIEFKRTPEYKKLLLGLTSEYIGSKTEINKFEFNSTNQEKPIIMANKIGYCIRTGVEIPFDPTRPFCYDAYKSWSSFGNPDYKEKYCHLTGKPSHGRTSMKNPILR